MADSFSKRIPPSQNLGKMQVPTSIELSLVTSVKLDDMAILDQVLGLAIADVVKRFEKDGFQVFVRTGLVRPMTQEELLSILPRKMHMAACEGGGWLCSTAHVSPRNVTEDPKEVSCKLCLKAMR